MAFAERLAELKKHRKAPSRDRQNRQNPPSVSFVSPERGAYPKNSEPTAPCPTCGGGDYYEADGWHCTRCQPPTEAPSRWLVVPGGTVPDGAAQDVDAVLHRAVAGTPVAVETLRAALDDDDVVEITHGRLSVAEVRAFAETLDQWPVEPPEAVTCATCTHYRRSEHHPHLGTCAAGVIPGGAAGLWDTDRRHCPHWRQP